MASKDKKIPEKADTTGSPAKKQKVSGNVIHGADKLPPGRAKGSESAGLSEDAENWTLEPSYLSNPSGVVFFRKCHQVLSYGYSYTRLPDGANKRVLTCTPFMDLNVEKPYMYMSPSEFDSLPNWATVEEVWVTARPFKSRVAFETNASASGLATLQQNQWIIKTENLAQRYPTTSGTYTAATTEPMIPTGIGPTISDLDFIQTLYGKGNNDPSFLTSVPALQFNKPYIWPNYVQFINSTNLNVGGDPFYCKKIVKTELNSMQGTEWLDYHYKPKCGYLKGSPPKFAWLNMGQPPTDPTGPAPTDVSNIYLDGSTLRLPITTTISGMEGEGTRKYTSAANASFADIDPATLGFDIKTDIEKYPNLIHVTRPVGSDGYVRQPKPLIGIEPIPRFSPLTTSGFQQINSFTDVQMWWELCYTMKVSHKKHFDVPLSATTTTNPNIGFIKSTTIDGFDRGSELYNGMNDLIMITP